MELVVRTCAVAVALLLARMREKIEGRVRTRGVIETDERIRTALMLPVRTFGYIKPKPTVGIARALSSMLPVPSTAKASEAVTEPVRVIAPVPVVGEEPVPVAALPLRVIEPVAVTGKTRASVTAPARLIEPVAVTGNLRTSVALPERAIDPEAIVGKARTSVALPARAIEPVAVATKLKASVAEPASEIAPVAVTG